MIASNAALSVPDAPRPPGAPRAARPDLQYDLRYHWYQGSFGGVEPTRFGYPRLAERVRAEPPVPHLAWCADTQETSRELPYVDRVHYTPALSERLAACIVDAIRASAGFSGNGVTSKRKRGGSRRRKPQRRLQAFRGIR